MRIRLLGTGSAEGWPNPWCGCASCEGMRARGETRGQSGAMVDGTLLLDCGPDVPRAAGRFGESLERVRSLLLTHSHPDHAGPAALLWRQWVPGLGPLEVAGPVAALDVMRPWADPRVSLRPLAGGQVATLASGHVVRAVTARHGDATTGECLLYDVTGPGGGRLLWATDTAAPLPDLAPGRFDAVFLECTAGDGPPLPGHHDLSTWAASVAALRRGGAVDARTTVVPIHLGHGNPPPPRLRPRFAAMGAAVHDDGDVLVLGEGSGAAETRLRPPRRVLITGGARSGKSLEAERRLAAEPQVTYVATALPRPGDASWADRVEAHRSRRPAHWETVETLDVAGLLGDQARVLLVDCVTLWLGAHLESTELEEQTDALVAAWRDARATAVLVTNEVGSAVHPPTELGRTFADTLGRLNARLADEADEVWLVVAGQPLRLR